jgi:hypothetical protein
VSGPNAAAFALALNGTFNAADGRRDFAAAAAAGATFGGMPAVDFLLVGDGDGPPHPG